MAAPLRSVTNTMSQFFPIREPGRIRRDAARKLRAVKVSGHFQAILGCLLEEDLDNETSGRDGYHA